MRRHPFKLAIISFSENFFHLIDFIYTDGMKKALINKKNFNHNFCSLSLKNIGINNRISPKINCRLSTHTAMGKFNEAHINSTRSDNLK